MDLWSGMDKAFILITYNWFSLSWLAITFLVSLFSFWLSIRRLYMLTCWRTSEKGNRCLRKFWITSRSLFIISTIHCLVSIMDSWSIILSNLWRIKCLTLWINFCIGLWVRNDENLTLWLLNSWWILVFNCISRILWNLLSTHYHIIMHIDTRLRTMSWFFTFLLLLRLMKVISSKHNILRCFLWFDLKKLVFLLRFWKELIIWLTSSFCFNRVIYSSWKNWACWNFVVFFLMSCKSIFLQRLMFSTCEILTH